MLQVTCDHCTMYDMIRENTGHRIYPPWCLMMVIQQSRDQTQTVKSSEIRPNLKTSLSRPYGMTFSPDLVLSAGSMCITYSSLSAYQAQDLSGSKD
jgi:hypothetical protein